MMVKYFSGARYIYRLPLLCVEGHRENSILRFGSKLELFFQVTTSIYNLILGKLYSDHYGTMRIQGNKEYSCKLKFKEQSIIDRNPHQVLLYVLQILSFQRNFFATI
jgi:hypothetical protein